MDEAEKQNKAKQKTKTTTIKKKNLLSSWGLHPSGKDGEYASKQIIRFPMEKTRK